MVAQVGQASSCKQKVFRFVSQSGHMQEAANQCFFLALMFLSSFSFSSPLSRINKRIKYLEINLANNVKDLYIENYKASLKEIEKDTMKWKDILC